MEGMDLELELTETSDVLAELGDQKEHRWVVGFALESRPDRRRPSGHRADGCRESRGA